MFNFTQQERRVILFLIGLWNPVVSLILGITGLYVGFFTGLFNTTVMTPVSLMFVVTIAVVIAFKMRT